MKSKAKISMVQLTQNYETVVPRMEEFFQQATEQGSDLIVFPEYALGYKVPIDHENVQQFLQLAKKYKMYAIAGLVEAHQDTDQWSTTALMVDREGNILGRYYKSHPASGVPPHWWPPIKGSDSEARGVLGNEFKTFALDFGTVGILQCYDGYFPEAWGCTSYAGAEVILWINGREGMVEDPMCLSAAYSYGCVVGANITNGFNTGFAGPMWPGIVEAEGEREEARLFPRVKDQGDAIVHATIHLDELRRHRKHLRQMHQRRPEMYGLLTRDVKMWHDYPDIHWDHPESKNFVNKSQL